MNDDDNASFSFRDDFEAMDKDFWYVGEWKTLFSAYDKVKLNNGHIKLEIDEVDRGPFLLSQPLTLLNDQILTIKRRVRISPTEDTFTGGLAIIETDDTGLLPSALNGNNDLLGNGIVLIEYVQLIDAESNRPGDNVFRVLPRTWMVNENYKLAPSQFNKWVEEEIIYNPEEETLVYILDGVSYKVTSQPMEKENFRVYMHGYGFGTGHSLEIDYFEVTIE
jgi:hypothetical protein